MMTRDPILDAILRGQAEVEAEYLFLDRLGNLLDTQTQPNLMAAREAALKLAADYETEVIAAVRAFSVDPTCEGTAPC